ncbi:glycosyltransferase family 2 protein [Accumulibacter sp.]|uniref:glycosyltransferase family 2 protein n=1 Tax=Accumulibacter sp. TaxID=2053492 RepID=UPI0028C3B15C|nr:glycosyltransferase family 2 protein [Accumulibacter sp.]
MIAVSIVSHGHGAMVERLVSQLSAFQEVSKIIVTRNVPESSALQDGERLKIINNSEPEGFGANHAAAFLHCHAEYFCVLNPDIELPTNPFPALIACMEEHAACLSAPLIVAPDGSIQDSMRRFPTPASLVRKAMGSADGRHAATAGQCSFYPEWVAGMFMLFRSADFARLGGFDTRYFLYYEDVDICVRAWQAGLRVVACPAAIAIHDARRSSRRSLRHLLWHVKSMIRYLLRYSGRLPAIPPPKAGGSANSSTQLAGNAPDAVAKPAPHHAQIGQAVGRQQAEKEDHLK